MRNSGAAAAAIASGSLARVVASTSRARAEARGLCQGYGDLVPDPAGVIDLPAGFQYRIFSRAGDPLSSGGLVPSSHDGMAAFSLGPLGNLLVRNHEIEPEDVEEDGALPADFATPETARLLDAQVWGQGFEPPVFCDRFELISQRLVGEKHLKLRLRQGGKLVDGIWFNHVDMLPERVTLAYRLSLDEWQGQQRVQYMIEAMQA